MKYPVGSEVIAALEGLPELRRRLRLGAGERSDQEMVRLLNNVHYGSIERLLRFIERRLPQAGAIGSRVIEQTDPFQLHQSCAELYLLAHLQEVPGVTATAVSPRSRTKRHDIDAVDCGLEARIEVYCPVDVPAAQLLEEAIRSVFKYLEVDRGYVLEVALATLDPMNVSWVYDIGSVEDVRAWLSRLESEARTWLGSRLPRTALSMPGPGEALRLTATIRELTPSPGERLITVWMPGKSTDARLIFECGAPEDTARSPFGRNLRSKLGSRQCGEPAAGVWRIFVLDFTLADTGWPDFFTRPRIAARLDAVIRLLYEDLGPPPPYDLVLPAHLGIECGFGAPIMAGRDPAGAAGRMVSALRLDRPFVVPATDQAPHLAALLEERC